MEPFIQIILAVMAILTPILVTIIGFLGKSKFRSIDEGIKEAKRDAEEAQKRSDEIESNYNAKFAEVNKNILTLNVGMESARATTIQSLYSMETKISNKLHDIQMAIVSGKLQSISPTEKSDS
ncbi:MAG: hypothetical protein M0R03_03495 [Novosphingobium sp.]|nr:hypothetical protein [Novosphingobium sp.]